MAATKNVVNNLTANLLPEDNEGTRLLNSFAIQPTEVTVYGDISVDEAGLITVLSGTSSANSYNPSGW
jgi:hypothetical protein